VATPLYACRSQPPPGWLATHGDRVIYAQWDREAGDTITGNGRMLEIAPADTDPYALAERRLHLQGTERGSSVNLSVQFDATRLSWTGNTRNGRLLLSLDGGATASLVEFRPAGPSAYAKAASELRDAMKAQASDADARRKVQLAVDADRQAAKAQQVKSAQAVHDEQWRQTTALNAANGALRAAMTKLNGDVKAMGEAKFTPKTYVQPIDDAFDQLKASSAAVIAAAADHDCANAAAEAARTAQRVAALIPPKTAFDEGVGKIHGQNAVATADIKAVETAAAALDAAIAVNPQAQPSSPLVKGVEWGDAVAVAHQRIASQGSAVLAAVTHVESVLADAATRNGDASRMVGACVPQPAPADAPVAASTDGG
jgi:hypothetical protein